MDVLEQEAKAKILDLTDKLKGTASLSPEEAKAELKKSQVAEKSASDSLRLLKEKHSHLMKTLEKSTQNNNDQIVKEVEFHKSMRLEVRR